jgi:tungstate transport system permease protein
VCLIYALILIQSPATYARDFIAEHPRSSGHLKGLASAQFLSCMNTFLDSAATALQLISDFDPGLWAIAGRSLGVSATACFMGCLIGIALGSFLGVSKFAGRGMVLTLLNTFLALPSVVVGLVIYLLLSRTGPLGFLGWLFSFKAMVLAQVVLVVPVAAALSRQVVDDAESAYGEQWRSLGAGNAFRCILLAWNERFALLTIVVACFGRAISEVGAVMIVGGNIEGFTRVMTTAIALETSKGDLPLALALGIILLGIVGCLNALLSLFRYWQDQSQLKGQNSLRGWVA